MPSQDNPLGHEVWGCVQSGCHGIQVEKGPREPLGFQTSHLDSGEAS